jgi:hypothetical protein
VASAEEIAWAAGLFEGEGTISQISRHRQTLDLQVAINMTDEDVLRRFDEIVGRGKVYGPYLPISHGDRRKPFWRWVAIGDAGHDVLDLIGPWLFPRRIEQARAHGVLLLGGPWTRSPDEGATERIE